MPKWTEKELPLPHPGGNHFIDDIRGRRFGRLVVLYPTNLHRSSGDALWLCKCDCGAYFVDSRNKLLPPTRRERSCGISCSLGANPYEIRDGVAYMKLFDNRGMHSKTALIDEEDLTLVKGFRWSVLVGSNKVSYVQCGVKGLPLHRFILGAHGVDLNGLDVDHVNHNGPDNRKCNLRPATRAQNNRNGRPQKSITSYRGVTYRARAKDKHYFAKIRVDGKCYSLGGHATPEAAAIAYNRAAREYHGEFACLNRVTLVLNKKIDLESRRA